MGCLLLFAQLACKGPCGEQKGKALSGATNGSVVANPSLSARSQAERMTKVVRFVFMSISECRHSPSPQNQSAFGPFCQVSREARYAPSKSLSEVWRYIPHPFFEKRDLDIWTCEGNFNMSRRGINPYMNGAWVRGLLINPYLHLIELGRWLVGYLSFHDHIAPQRQWYASIRGKIFSAVGCRGFNYFAPFAFS